MFEILAYVATVAVLSLGIAIVYYLRGVREGYGYAREPGHPEFRTAGRFLRRRYAARWPELVPPTDHARAVKIGELKLFRGWCIDQLSDCTIPEEFRANTEIRLAAVEQELAELEAGLR